MKVASDLSQFKCPEGFEELRLPFNVGGQRLVSSDPIEQARGLSLKLYGHSIDKSIQGFASCGPMMEGPPGFVHGGILAYILDEAMGSAAWNLKKPVVAEKIEVSYLKMVPQHQVFKVEARLNRIESDRVIVDGALMDLEQKILTRGVGRFHILTSKQLHSIAAHAKLELPEWLKNF